ncbi:coiled-coil domain-containing protein [Aliarcobacter butzleri]|uniref:coiled-coil domain-containing protein n=1 Tax=Aliarcobacter butzleri TaxID=28197 RepID=UPI00244A5675|nr:hypothetical protein [Aliarcobacter butzleri]MDH1976345.1 hypothetical protein [Aliarcobacter butzleri]
MKNNVCVRIQTFKKEDFFKIEEHNEKHTNYGNKVEYLLKENEVLGENVHYEFNNLNQLEEQRLSILKQEKKEDYQIKHGVEFEISLSYDQLKSYLENGKKLEEIDQGFLNYTKKLQETFGFTPLRIDIHRDEGYVNENGQIQPNYHCHILMHNFNFDTKRAISSNLEKKDYRKMQDLAQFSFKEKGFDFFRGVSKFKTKLENQKRNDFVKTKQNKEIRQKFFELDQQQKKLKETYTLLNRQKNELKTLRSEYEKETKEFQKLSNKIFELQKLEQDKRREYRELEQQIKLEKERILIEQSSTKNKIKEIFKENTSLQKNLLGNEYIKIEDYEKLYEEIVNEINKPYQYQIDENDILKKELERLKLNENELKKWIDKSVKALEIEQKKAKQHLKKIRKLENRSSLMFEFLKFKGFKLSDFREFEQNKKNLDEKVTSLLTRF